MFTGIIKKIAEVKNIERTSGGLVLQIVKSGLRAKAGDSISIDGVCSTIAKDGTTFKFQYMPETLSRSNLKNLKKGDLVNLEASLRASDKLDGHIVLGHVDTLGKITKIIDEGNSKVFTIAISESGKYMKYVAEKGSIAVQGVSLTVVSLDGGNFVVKLVPYTWEHTSLKNLKVGSEVNLEFDILAKYLERLIK